MFLRQFYFSVLAITLLIMTGAFFLLHNAPRNECGDLEEIVWMERLRRNVMEEIAAIRQRVQVQANQPTVVLVDGNQADSPAIANVGDSERLIAIQLLETSREQIIEAENVTGEVSAQMPGYGLPDLSVFQVRDRLWDLTIAYIDCLEDIFSKERPVPSSEVARLENQISSFEQLLDRELEKRGLEP